MFLGLLSVAVFLTAISVCALGAAWVLYQGASKSARTARTLLDVARARHDAFCNTATEVIAERAALRQLLRAERERIYMKSTEDMLANPTKYTNDLPSTHQDEGGTKE